MFILDISIILDKKLIKKWFVAENVDNSLKEKFTKLMMNYYTIRNSRNDKFKFIYFIEIHGVDAFFNKMKADYSLKEVSLNDLVYNYLPGQLKESYSIILDVDETTSVLSDDLVDIWDEYDCGEISLKDAIDECKKIGINIPLLSVDCFSFNSQCKKVWAIDCSEDMDSEYHSDFLLFENEYNAILFKELFKNGPIGENMFRYNIFSTLIEAFYGATYLKVEDLPLYKGRISFIDGPIYFGEDAF